MSFLFKDVCEEPSFLQILIHCKSNISPKLVFGRLKIICLYSFLFVKYSNGWDKGFFYIKKWKKTNRKQSIIEKGFYIFTIWSETKPYDLTYIYKKRKRWKSWYTKMNLIFVLSAEWPWYDVLVVGIQILGTVSYHKDV